MREGRRRIFVVCAAAALVVAAGVASRRQAAIWRDSGTLFAAMTRHPHFQDDARQAGHVYLLWARDVALAGDAARATELSGRARAIYLDAIKAALARGEPDEALSLLTHVERFFGLTPELRREKGAWLLHAGRVAAALPELRAAAAALPHDARAQRLLAEAERTGERP
jgi:predicted Zn-dependent protease